MTMTSIRDFQTHSRLIAYNHARISRS